MKKSDILIAGVSLCAFTSLLLISYYLSFPFKNLDSSKKSVENVNVIIEPTVSVISNSKEYVPTNEITETIDGVTTTYERRDFKGKLKPGASYLIHRDSGGFILEGLVDEASYTKLKDFAGNRTHYGKDKDFVFYFCVQEPCVGTIENAEPDSFNVLLETSFLDGMPGEIPSLHVQIAKDRNQVYFGEFVIEGVDAQSFTILKDQQGNYSSFAKDRSHIYSIIDIADQYTKPSYLINDVNYESFEVVGPLVAKDKYKSYSFFEELLQYQRR